jgi:hypothetical protein
MSQCQQGDLVDHHRRLSNVLERICRPSCEPLYATNTFRRKQEPFLYEYHLHWVLPSTKKCTTERCSSVVNPQARSHVDYWNKPLNIRMRVCNVDCHAVGLCCYLVIHIDTMLRPLQLFYFHLWPIYWLSLVLQTDYTTATLNAVVHYWKIYARFLSVSPCEEQGQNDKFGSEFFFPSHCLLLHISFADISYDALKTC